MVPTEIRSAIIDILADIAPDEDLSNLNDDKSFRRYRVQVPEEDYVNLESMASTVTYLTPKMVAVA